MLWFCGERPTDSLERKLVDIRLSGLELKDPVYVDMLTGLVHDIQGITTSGKREKGGISFSGLPLWDSPVVIIERSEVKM